MGGGDRPPAVAVWAQGAVVLASIGVVLARSGLWHVPVPAAVPRVGVWLMAAVFLLLAVNNLLRPTVWERLLLAPLGLLLAALAVSVALRPSGARAAVGAARGRT